MFECLQTVFTFRIIRDSEKNPMDIEKKKQHFILFQIT